MRQRRPSKIFSRNRYYHAATPEASPRPSREERRVSQDTTQRQSKILVRFLLIGAITFGGWYFGSLNGKVSVQSSQLEETTALTTALQKRLTGWRRIKLLLNPAGLSQELKAEFPELAQLQLRTTFASRQLQAAAIYRRPVALLIDGQNRVLGAVDDQGVVYVDESVATDELPRVEEATPLNPVVDEPFIASRALTFIRQVDIALAAASQTVRTERHHYRLVEQGREVHLISRHPFIVKFSIDRSAQDQINELAELLRYFAAHRSTPANYVDLRVDDTAYYR